MSSPVVSSTQKFTLKNTKIQHCHRLELLDQRLFRPYIIASGQDRFLNIHHICLQDEIPDSQISRYLDALQTLLNYKNMILVLFLRVLSTYCDLFIAMYNLFIFIPNTLLLITLKAFCVLPIALSLCRIVDSQSSSVMISNFQSDSHVLARISSG